MSLIGRLREERGQTIPIVVVLMFAMLGMAAFVVDVGSWYVGKRQVQSAADAAALAGVQDLPGSAATATTDAQSYVGKNVSGATVTVTTPYSSDASKIAVTVTKNVSGIFGGMFGITSTAVTATAVAKRNSTGSTSSFFAYDTNCGNNAITINGNNITIAGGIHSNGAFFQNSNNGNFGASTYGGPSACSLTANGINNTYSGGAPTRDATKEPWPTDFSKSPPACTYSASSFSWNANSVTIPSGVYCATGQIVVNGNNISGDVTFIADSFQLNGNNFSFTPYSQGLLIYQTGTTWLNVNGNNLSGGTIFAPNAGVIVNGNNGTGTGYVEALDVTLNGNNFAFTGNGPALSGTGSNALVQ